ncbi:MAG: glycosyltransferase family 4 protein [Bryobacterales bacterium]|nr:glycosyltransferase family 4 protein [Bryobacterales bacterium]
MSIRKGLHYLLQAFQELDLPDAELWLVGPPTAETELLLKKYRSQRIVLRGTFPQAELRREYARASVFCLPSIEEGFAMVITQAMACAVPVIASENTTGTDLIREGVDGYVIPIRDVEALKQRVMTLYRDPERRREMGRNARRRIETAGTWDHYGTRLEDEYRRLIEKGCASRRHEPFGPGGAR